MNFTHDEINLMCIYNTGSREGLIAELTEMQSHLVPDEKELVALTVSALGKLGEMSDADFDNIADSLVADFEE